FSRDWSSDVCSSDLPAVDRRSRSARSPLVAPPCDGSGRAPLRFHPCSCNGDPSMRGASIDAMPDRPEGRMGAYSLIAPLGTGGMGAVYLARKLGLDEPDRYAIKVMLPHLSGDERFTSLFLHEARIATR